MREPTDRGKMIDDEKTMSALGQSDMQRAGTPVIVDFQDRTNRSIYAEHSNAIAQPENNANTKVHQDTQQPLQVAENVGTPSEGSALRR